MTRRFSVSLGVSSVLMATATALSQSPVGPVNRRMFDGRFEEVATAPAVGVYALGSPGTVDGNGGIVALYDYADHRLKVFDARARPLWTTGGKDSAGAGIFSNPTDLRVVAQGEVWVLDAPRRSLTVFDRTGRRLRTIELTRDIDRFALPADGRIWGTDGRAKQMWYAFSRTGVILDSISAPSYLEHVDDLAREGLVALAGPGLLAVAHRYGPAVAIWSLAGRSVMSNPGVESFGFAKVTQWNVEGGGVARRIPSGSTRGARAVTGDSTHIYVLFSGTTAQAGRLIDSYATPSGEYRGTYLLPQPASGLVRTPTGFWVLTSGDQPKLSLLRWSSGGKK